MAAATADAAPAPIATAGGAVPCLRALPAPAAWSPGAALAFLVPVPLLLQPGAPEARAWGLCAAVVLLVILADSLAAKLARPAGEAPRRWGFALAVLLAGAAVAASLGSGLPVLAVLLLGLRAGAHRGTASPLPAAALAAAAAGCCAETGALAVGAPHGAELVLAAAGLGAFLGLVGGLPGAGPGRVAQPGAGALAREGLMVLILAACVAANLALLGSGDRVAEVGDRAAFLPALPLLLGLGRCLQLAWTRPGFRPSLRDPVLALAAAGWAAACLAGPVALDALAGVGTGR